MSQMLMTLCPDPQVLLGGIFLGALYGLAAIGFQFILGTTGQVYLAFGHVWIMAASVVGGVMARHALPLPAVFAFLAGAGALAGSLLHPGRLWQGGDTPDRSRRFFLTTLGLALILEDIGIRIWPLPSTALSWAPASLQWRGLMISPVKLMVLVLVLATAGMLMLFLSCHRLGKALRAWDRGNGYIWLTGVSARRLGRLSMAIGLGIAGMAGGFLSLSYAVGIQEGMAMTLRCLVLAVMGGVLSPWLVMVCGLGLGVAEAWVSQVAGAQWSPLLGCGLLVGVLPLRAMISGGEGSR